MRIIPSLLLGQRSRNSDPRVRTTDRLVWGSSSFHPNPHSQNACVKIISSALAGEWVRVTWLLSHLTHTLLPLLFFTHTRYTHVSQHTFINQMNTHIQWEFFLNWTPKTCPLYFRGESSGQMYCSKIKISMFFFAFLSFEHQICTLVWVVDLNISSMILQLKASVVLVLSLSYINWARCRFHCIAQQRKTVQVLLSVLRAAVSCSGCVSSCV